jgi:hypothetical protein
MLREKMIMKHEERGGNILLPMVAVQFGEKQGKAMQTSRGGT